MIRGIQQIINLNQKPAASCTFNSSSYEWECPVARPTSEWFMDGSTKV